MIENSFVFISMLSINFAVFGCMSFYHYRKRERMLEKYKLTLVLSKALLHDGIMNGLSEFHAVDLMNIIDKVLDEN